MNSLAIVKPFIVPGWNLVVKKNPQLAKTIANTVLDKLNFEPLVEKVLEIIKQSPIATKMVPDRLKDLSENIVYWRSKTDPVTKQIITDILKTVVAPLIRSRL